MLAQCHRQGEHHERTNLSSGRVARVRRLLDTPRLRSERSSRTCRRVGDAGALRVQHPAVAVPNRWRSSGAPRRCVTRPPNRRPGWPRDVPGVRCRARERAYSAATPGAERRNRGTSGSRPSEARRARARRHTSGGDAHRSALLHRPTAAAVQPGAVLQAPAPLRRRTLDRASGRGHGCNAPLRLAGNDSRCAGADHPRRGSRPGT